jgi:hypothetical protein
MIEFQRMVLALFKTKGFDPEAESLLHAAVGISTHMHNNVWTR